MKLLWDWGRLALMMLGSTLLSGRPVGVSTVASHTLESVAPPTSLRRGYRLPVVAVPAPPPSAAPAAPAAPAVPSNCPVQVRAIVAGGDQPSDSFAILGTADGSVLVHDGAGVHTAHGWFTVSSLRADHVILRHGDATFRCLLAGSSASPAPTLRSAR